VATRLTGPSFWQAHAGPAPATRRPPLAGDTEADVCIVGAGYTGLWTAHSLLQLEPDLKIVMVEAAHAGFGASGRNGGWLSGLMPGNRSQMASGPGGRDGVVAFQQALIDAVAEIGSVVASEGIDCDYVRGGTLAVARNAAQMERLRRSAEEDRRWGCPSGIVDRDFVTARLAVAGAVGGVWNPHCARIQPAKLAYGLAHVVEKRGVRIYEHSPVRAVGAGLVTTAAGRVSAPWVVLATEGYTASLPGRRRRLLPMNSSMIVTAPLPDWVWEMLGWSRYETVSDAAHAYVYLQRTADGRIAIGGRGVPYRYGSRAADPAFIAGPPASVAEALMGTLQEMFPTVPASVWKIDAAWSGVLGVARDWCPAVGVASAGSDTGGMAWAGGYVGDGVTTSYLAGRTLADLILGRSSPLTGLPWVGHEWGNWEPEPLRWLGVRAVYGLYRAADRSEAAHPDRTRSSRWAGLADRLAGR
jgi:glycine/D-amino acid oxidase-like deaminating enzyme